MRRIRDSARRYVRGRRHSRKLRYVDFCRRVARERGHRCQACGRSAEEAGQRRLHVHHLWPIARTGLDDALATARCNVLLLCDWCHGLQHQARYYEWGGVGVKRGRQL